MKYPEIQCLQAASRKTRIKDEKTRIAFVVDVEKLHLAKTREIFDKAVDLFIKKWTPIAKKMTEYFQTEWLSKHRNWYEAFADRTPSTNNALESLNKVIKSSYTHRERLDLAEFKVVLFRMVREWSVSYESTLIRIRNDDAEIDLPMWTLTYNWVKLNVKLGS